MLHGGVGAVWRLHPFIHTLLKFNLVQDFGGCQLELLSIYDNGVGFVNRGEYELDLTEKEAIYH